MVANIATFKWLLHSGLFITIESWLIESWLLVKKVGCLVKSNQCTRGQVLSLYMIFLRCTSTLRANFITPG